MAEETVKDIEITRPGFITFGVSALSFSNFIIYNDPVIQVSCGMEHSALLCKSGRVFTFGSNKSKFNQMGLGDVANTVGEPTLVAALNTISVVYVACGYYSTFFLSDTGELFACGSNEYGQLGCGETQKHSLSIQVTGIPKIRKVAAGYSHAVALADNGEVLGTGSNSSGQLGLGITNAAKPSFTHIPNVCNSIIDMSCGYYHTAILSKSGELFLTGSNNYGQLGVNAQPGLRTFQPLTLPSAVAAVACGDYHTVALTVDGTAWAWGRNDFGQLGIGHNVASLTPMKMIGVEGLTIAQVFAGGCRTALLTEDGNVLLCGKGDKGELGHKKMNRNVATLMSKLQELAIKQVAFAESYTLMVVEQLSKDEPAQQEYVEITNWERTIMTSLQCPVCLRIMCAPIHLCTQGHSICNTCQSRIRDCPTCRRPLTLSRNIALENISAEVQLPCEDCLERMPACLMEKHSVSCPERTYDCPVQKACGWVGRPNVILAHTSTAHPGHTWCIFPHLFLHTDLEGHLVTNILSAHGRVFLLHRICNQKDQVFNAAVQLIGPARKDEKYKFELQFIADDDVNLTFRKKVSLGTGSISDLFKSDYCVSLKKELLDIFLHKDKLLCEVAVLNAESRNPVDRIKTLVTVE